MVADRWRRSAHFPTVADGVAESGQFPNFDPPKYAQIEFKSLSSTHRDVLDTSSPPIFVQCSISHWILLSSLPISTGSQLIEESLGISRVVIQLARTSQ